MVIYVKKKWIKLIGIILIVNIFLSLFSCSKSYELSENANELSYGLMGDYGYRYQDNIYYLLPKNTYVVGLKEGIKRGKIYICDLNLGINGEVVFKRGYLFKEKKTYLITIGENEVICLSEGVSILYEYQEYKK